jgi:hypothetical protein
MSEADDLVERLRREKRRWKAAALATWAVIALMAFALFIGVVQARRQAERALAEAQRVEEDRQGALRLQGEDRLRKARDAMAREDWAAGKVILSGLLVRIEGEPRLADLRTQAGELLIRIDRGLAEQRRTPRGPKP